MTKEERYEELLKKVKECSLNQKCDNLTYCEECQQVNMWSYWQGGKDHLNAQILLVGQDWGGKHDAERLIKEYGLNGTDDTKKYCEFIRDNKPTKYTSDTHLTKLFASIDYDVTKNQPDIFFTNLALCYRDDNKISGGFRAKWASNCGEFFKELVDIIEPKVILCLGRGTYEGVMKALGGKAEKGPYNEIIDAHTPSEAGGYKVFPLAHCGSMGTANRNKGKVKKECILDYQKEDWQAIQKYL